MAAISKYTENRQRRIRAVSEASAGLMPMVMMIVVFMSTFIVYTYKRDMLEYECQQLDGNLTYSLLASAVVNTEVYAESGNPVIADSVEPDSGDSAFFRAYMRFIDCFRCNMSSGGDMSSESASGMCKDIKIVYYKIYNYIVDEEGFRIVECGISDGQAYTLRHAQNKHVKVQANGGIVDIEETSVCAEITFNIEGIGEYSFTRLIAVTG